MAYTRTHKGTALPRLCWALILYSSITAFTFEHLVILLNLCSNYSHSLLFIHPLHSFDLKYELS